MENKSEITWDEYFMGIAILSSKRSKDPNTKVGACIVNSDKRVISIGYNGMIKGIDESKLSWNKGNDLDSKYLYVCHAELNAILNASTSIKGATIYVTLFPCNECTKALIQAGIKKIIYLDDKYHDEVSTISSRKMLDLMGVTYIKYNGRVKDILLN